MGAIQTPLLCFTESYTIVRPHLQNLYLIFTQSVSIDMDGELYDEFGNYIGPEIESESDESSVEEENQDQEEELEEEEEQSQAIVLHEDKQYYPSALQVYGEEVS